MNGKKAEYERESENEWQKLEGKIRRIAAILTKIWTACQPAVADQDQAKFGICK